MEKLDFVIWSDEAYLERWSLQRTWMVQFKPEMPTSRWSSENPHAFVTRSLHSESLFQQKLLFNLRHRKRYTWWGRLLEHLKKLSCTLSEEPSRLFTINIYQHDGAPLHIKGNVQEFLKSTFREETLLISHFNIHPYVLLVLQTSHP